MTVTRTVLDPDAEERLAPLLAQVCDDPAALPRAVARASRVVGRGPGPEGLRVEDVARARLVVAACERSADATAVLTGAWDDGDADERRAVLLALADVDVADAAVPIVLDALRTNDLRLVAAAMGPYAAAHLPAEHWRHGVLKCLFTGIPLSAVAGLDVRRDAELDRMVADYAAERKAAGREVPADAERLLATRTSAP
ncbi:EboA domain-containing protein [Isoptericola aurantiacus]|uniref:EboA domain-containing protein n=1 Tax=Isoptericola aurantiacus TaxID=3377839 RepID=UPI00383B7342